MDLLKNFDRVNKVQSCPENAEAKFNVFPGHRCDKGILNETMLALCSLMNTRLPHPRISQRTLALTVSIQSKSLWP